MMHDFNLIFFAGKHDRKKAPGATKQFCLALLQLLCIALLLTGCTTDEKQADRKEQGSPPPPPVPTLSKSVYHLPLLLSPVTLDPAYLQDQYGISVAVQLFDGLVQFGPYLALQPAVAKSWNISDNGKTFTFHLRPDVYFHNGRQVTANDVVFSLQRLLRARPAPSILPHLLKIEGAVAYRDSEKDLPAGLSAVDDMTLIIRLTEPHAPLLNALAMYQAAIVPADLVVKNEADFGRLPVGCGPFRFKEWQPQTKIILERFPQYYAGQAYLFQIEFHLYPESGLDQIIQDFTSHKLEEMPVLGKVRQELQNDDQYQWEHRPSLSLLYYGINTSNGQLGDLRLRKALSLAIDRRALVKTVYNNQFEPAGNVLPPGMPARYQQNAFVQEDLAAAKQLMADIRENNPDFNSQIEVVTASNSAFAQAELDYLEKCWARIGIRLQRKIIPDWSLFEAYLRSNAVQIYRYSWTADMPDPDNFLRPLFSSSSPDNYTRANYSEIDTLLDQASTMIDDLKRADLYRSVELQALRHFSVLPMFYLSIDRVYQPSVHDMQITALGTHTVRLNRVKLESPPAPQ